MNIKSIIQKLIGRGMDVESALDLAFDITSPKRMDDVREAVIPLPSFLQPAEPVKVASTASEPANGEYEPTWPDDVTEPVAAVLVASEPVTEPKAKRRRYKARKAYQLTDKAVSIIKGTVPAKHKVAAAELVASLVPSWSATMKAITKAKRPVTARELESLANQGRKTVESSLTQLRKRGLVVSVPRPTGK